MMKQTIKTFLALLALLVSSTGVWAQKTAYAVLTGDGNNKTLTFKYEVHTVSGSTEWDVSNTGSELPGWTNEKDNITQVVFDPSFDEARPKSCAYWFSNCEELTTITGIGNLNTSQVTNISSMFAFCRSLTKLDLSHFNTSNVIEMDFMFSSCSSLQSLDLSNFDTGNVTNMRGMFWASKNLTSLDVSSFNTEKVTNMRSMFYDCNNLTSLDLSNFDTRNVTDMGYMFSECTNLTSLTIGGGFTVGSSTDVNYMFNNCTNLASGTLKVIGTIVPNIERDIFSGVYTGGTLITDKALNISSGWKGGTFNTVKRMTAYAVLTDNTDGDGTKTLTFKYEVHTASGENEWDLSNETNYKDIQTGYTCPYWSGCYSDRNITQVVFDESFADAPRLKNCSWWFEGLEHLTTIKGLEYLNTSEVTSMAQMFAGCSSLTSLDLSHFNTSQVTNMSCMFQDCHLLTNITFGDNFNTSIVRSMMRMFSGCIGLTTLDVSQFDTGKVEYMIDMFRGCSGLTSLDVSHFNTSQVTDMSYMFQGCSNLTCLTIGSGFEVKDNTATGDMFSGCTKLANGTLYVKGTSAPNIDQDIFTGVYTDGTLITEVDLADPMDTPFNWHGGTFTNAKRMWAYAVLEGNTIMKGLRFKYDSEYTGASNEYDVTNTGTSNPGWYSSSVWVVSVTFDPSFADARPKSCAEWFKNSFASNITGLEYLNTSEVETMKNMFSGCSLLSSLDLSHFNTSKVTDMSEMFSGCSELTDLSISSDFTVSSSTNTSSMFSSSLKSGTLRVRGAEPAIDKDDFFSGFTGTLIADVDLPANWKGGNFNNLVSMRAYAELTDNTDGAGTKTLTFKYGEHPSALNNTTEWDVTDTGTSQPWSSEAANITQVVFEPSFVESRPKSFCKWFYNCSSLTSLTINEGFRIGEFDNTDNIFDGCTALATGSLYVKGNNVPQINKDIFTVFTGGTLIAEVDLADPMPSPFTWKGGTFTNAKRMRAYAVLDGSILTFKYEEHPSALGANEWDVSDTGDSDPSWGKIGITQVVFDPSFANARPRSCKNWFSMCQNLTNITGLSNLNTSEVTNMNNMFNNCKKLTSLDLSHFNTSNVTNMNRMFYCCGPTNLDLSSFNTSKVTDMGSMFSTYSNLKSLTIGKDFTVGSGTYTDEMFYGTSLNTLIIKGTTPPSINRDIFVQEGTGSYKIDNCNLATEMTAATLGATGPDGDGKYTWKGGTFVSIGKVNVSYVDEDGNAQTSDAMPLITSTTSLSGGWYYVEGDVTINHSVQLTGKAQIILYDGAKLTVNGETHAGISGNYDLNIFGQATGSGQLIIHSDTDKAIDCYSLSIYDGNVETGCSYGIYSATDVVIDGGVVIATGEDGDGIYAGGNVTINGGQVTATGSDGHYGINAGGIITLGFTAQEDFILANSYNGTVKTAAGKGFSIAGGGTLDGGITLDDDQKTAIAGKKLTPIVKAQIGTDYYSSLQGALDVANDNDIIEILSDINEPTTTKTYTGDHNHTFNLNGHSVTFDSYSAMGALTINGSGTLTCNTLHNTNVGNDNTLTIDGATVICNGSTSPAVTPGIEWSADHIVLKGGANVTVYNGLFLGGGDDEFTFTIQDKASIFKMIDCTISGYGSNDVLRNQFLPYVEPGHEAELIVDGTTTNSLTFKKDWGLILVSDLTNATVTFYKAADIATFNTESPGTVATWANAPDYVVMHIVPDAGYWTNQELLFAMETGVTLAPSMRAPGLDLGQVPTLLKADEGYSNGAGWYYYQIPAAHTTDSYKTSTVDGFVVPTFDLSNATASVDGKTLTVASGDWNTTVSIDANTFSYNGTAQGPAINIITMQVKKGSTDVCTLPVSGNVSLSGNSQTDVGNYNATLSGDANGCFSNSIAVPFNIYRVLTLFSGSNAWATYVAQENLALPAGLTAYIVTGVNGNTVATTALTYIPKDVAILVQRTDNTNNSYNAYAGTGTDDVSDNKLLGSATAATDIQIHKDYVLYNDRFELAGVNSVPAGKAYLPATALGGTAAPNFLYIEGGSTGVALIDNGELIIDNDVWYTLDGRKLDKAPTIKGVYIRNGVKVVVK